VPPVTAVPSDEIHEKYLQKAIAEINELGDEIARAAGGAAVPVLGSGHPLADIFLLKWAPQVSESQEGVAFFGRAGEAVKRSLDRLHVDKLAVYGTNCIKLAEGAADAEAQPGELQGFTPTIEALYCPDIDASLDDQTGKTSFWNAFKVVGSWWAELPPY
jgi:uracil-DNA glycosylase